MKNRKNYLSCLLMTLLFVCMIQVYTVNAAVSPSLSASADKASVSAGDDVLISINLSGNPSISTFGASLSYDSNILSYDSVSWNSSFSESDMKLASDIDGEVNLSVVCDSSYGEDGTIVTVRFQAVSDSSSIPVILSLRDMADADLNAVSDCAVSSQVHVPETEGSTNQGTDKEDGTPDLSAPETGTAAGGRVQQTSTQNTQSVQVSDTKSTKPDQSYKTGAGLGNDIFLILAAACGIIAFVLAAKKYGEEKK